MPKIILNDKRMFGREKPFKIQINGEKKELNLERKQELEVNNGECELRIFESFFMVKSPKVKLEVSDKKLELDCQTISKKQINGILKVINNLYENI